MATITTRNQFREYILRRLGDPVIQINVDPDQIEDRIDDALLMFYDYHYDGSEKVLISHQVTADNKTNKYIDMNTIDTNIIGVVDLLRLNSTNSSSSLFNVRYQLHLNDFFNITSANIVPYYTAMTHISFLEEMLTGNQPFRYNQHVNRLYIDMDWDLVNAGEYIVIVAYRKTDPTTYADVWNDRWLKEYATQLVKRQWGEHLKKFDQMQLIGGTTFSGQQIWQEADEKVRELEDRLLNDYSLPVTDHYG